MRQCGTISTYKAGCRCDDCTAASAEKQREYRRRHTGYYERRDTRVEHPGWPDWYDDAPCRDQTDLFFASLYERDDRRETRELAAKRVCAGCPAMGECRELGRRNREFGVWGGETELERARAGCGPELSTGRV